MALLDIQEILEILPHRYPMLLVDRVLEWSHDRIVGIKNVTVNEPHFAGHFPSMPVMPGVLIVEAMAQVAGILVSKTVPNSKGKLMFLASVDEARFRKPVLPGDQLRIEMTVLKRRTTIIRMQGAVTVEGQPVAEAIVMCKLVDPVPIGAPSVEVAEPQMA